MSKLMSRDLTFIPLSWLVTEFGKELRFPASKSSALITKITLKSLNMN